MVPFYARQFFVSVLSLPAGDLGNSVPRWQYYRFRSSSAYVASEEDSLNSNEIRASP